MVTTLKLLQNVASESFDRAADEIDVDKSLDAYGIDSLGLVELMCAIEDKIGRKLPLPGKGVVNLRQLADWLDGVLAGDQSQHA